MSNCVTSLWWFFSPRGIIQNYSPRFFTHKLRGGEGNMELLFHEGVNHSGAGAYQVFFKLTFYTLDGGNWRWQVDHFSIDPVVFSLKVKN